MAMPPEDALRRFHQGYNCAQSLLSAFAPQFGLDEELALRLAGPFGAGIARRGEMCGAVSGGLMALGLCYGTVHVEDPQAQRRMYAQAEAFLRRFEQRFGSLDCRRLLGLDLSQPGNVELAEQRGLFMELCPAFVRGAAEMVETLASQQPPDLHTR